VSSMARLKRVARHHTGGESSTCAAVVAAIAQSEGETVDFAHSEFGRKVRDITHVWALEKDNFGGHCERGQFWSPENQIPGGELHPFVRGFLKLLGTIVIVPMADLAILVVGDCSPSDGPQLRPATSENGDAEQDVIFERMRLTFDPDLGADDHACWRTTASKRGVAEWHEVSVLSYDAFSGHKRVNFADYADVDPAERSLWGEWAKMDADMIWRGYKQCKGRVMAQMKNGPKKAQATVIFRKGSRGISETEIREERPPVQVPHSRSQDVSLSCVSASLANLLAEDDPYFALELLDATRNEIFSSLR
jgi:hypothetical protein